MTIYDEIEEIRRGLEASAAANNLVFTASPLDFWFDRDAAEKRSLKDRHDLQPWLAAAELAAQVLYSLHRYSLATYQAAGRPPSFAMLSGRACNFAVAVTTLVARGLDEAAIVLTRSFLENIDIALVAAADDGFARRYFETRESKKFWNKEIARGTIHTKAEEVYVSVGVIDSDLKTRRDNEWQRMSAATHASFSSAFGGAAALSLSDQSLIASPLGFVGMRGPGILAVVAGETNDFVATLLRRFIRFPGSGPQDSDEHQLFDPVATAHFTLQQLLTRIRRSAPKSSE